MRSTLGLVAALVVVAFCDTAMAGGRVPYAEGRARYHDTVWRDRARNRAIAGETYRRVPYAEGRALYHATVWEDRAYNRAISGEWRYRGSYGRGYSYYRGRR